jgi:hypothetical protein
VTGASFVEVADEAAEFDCDTAPSFPGLSTRTETFLLLGSICFADESPIAAWSVDADWSADWTPEPPCDCVAVCVVGAVLVAVADDAAEFDCVTGPSFPGLSTRTETFSLLGAICVAEDAAPASCPVEAD